MAEPQRERKGRSAAGWPDTVAACLYGNELGRHQGRPKTLPSVGNIDGVRQ